MSNKLFELFKPKARVFLDYPEALPLVKKYDTDLEHLVYAVATDCKINCPARNCALESTVKWLGSEAVAQGLDSILDDEDDPGRWSGDSYEITFNCNLSCMSRSTTNKAAELLIDLVDKAYSDDLNK